MRHLASALLAALALVVACDKKPDDAPPVATPTTPATPPTTPAAADAHAGHGDHHAAPGTPSPTSTKSVNFVWPHDGSTVFSEVDVAFGVNGMGLRKAGEDPLDKTSGHHHILIDSPSVPLGQVVPKDATHLHYGDAQTSARLTLPVGAHELEMQLADGAHLSYGPELATRIKVNVKEKPQKMGVSFANLKDGDVVKNPVVVKFAVDGFTLRPAGEDVLDKTSGHHHVLIDGQPNPVGAVVPKDEKNLHFGKAETETTLTLSPGDHTLTLQLADGAHMSYGPAMSSTVKIKVQ